MTEPTSHFHSSKPRRSNRSDPVHLEPLQFKSLELKSLREQVYEYLRDAINRGDLRSGGYLDLNRISQGLGISRTPLRDALLQLEAEGFVSILPRRGVIVQRLALEDVRHLYELIGALEGAAVMSGASRLEPSQLDRMGALNEGMNAALDDADFDLYYELNLAFHDIFLAWSDNSRLLRTLELSKHRLYDFPRRDRFVADWERASTGEHAAFVDLLSTGDVRGAADFLRDVHWSFEVQRPWILQYYFANGEQT